MTKLYLANSSILNIDSQVNTKVWYDKPAQNSSSAGIYTFISRKNLEEKEAEQSYSDLLNSLFYSLNYTLTKEQNKAREKDKSLCVLPMIQSPDESNISNQFQNMEDSQKNISIFDEKGSMWDNFDPSVQKHYHIETLKEIGELLF